RARGRARHQPRASLQRAGRRQATGRRAAVACDARAHPRRPLGRHALPALGAVDDARPLLRAARLGCRRCPDAGAPLRSRPVGSSVRVISWNIRAGGGRRVPAIADQIARWAADVVALSEFRGTPPSSDLARALASRGLAHQLSTASPGLPGANALLIASRWPLARGRLRSAPRVEAGRWLVARVASPCAITLGAMHVPNRVTGRKLPFLDAVLGVAHGWRGGPALLIGDTNSGLIDLDEESPAFGV